MKLIEIIAELMVITIFFSMLTSLAALAGAGIAYMILELF